MKIPVFDLHCDTALALLDDGKNLCKNDLHIDLTRAGELPGYAQCFACFTTTLYDSDPVSVFEKELSGIQRQIQEYSDRIRLVHSVSEIEENCERGMTSAILTIEGPAGFHFDWKQLASLHEIGFRITTLGWNERNPLTGSHATGGGLTELGKKYVKEAQRLNMLIDVSHISDEAFWDIIQITEKPIIASHSNSRTVHNVSRNLTDDMFLAICKTGGVVGINLYADFLGKDATLDTVCDHILHFMDLDPTGLHIGLGGDLDGCDQLPAGFNGIQDYPRLAEQLLSHGVDYATVYNIFWNNALGVIKKCCM